MSNPVTIFRLMLLRLLFQVDHVSFRGRKMCVELDF